MNDFQKAFHELEMMQELGMLEKGTNICEIADDYYKEKQETEALKEYKDTPSQDLENHMVIGEYYGNEGEEKYGD